MHSKTAIRETENAAVYQSNIWNMYIPAWQKKDIDLYNISKRKVKRQDCLKLNTQDVHKHI